MPKQLQRLLLAFLIFISLFLIIRHFLVPESFYKYGHYRGDALKDNEAHEIKYIDAKECENCHTDIDTLKLSGSHKNINCQTCHGAGYKHILDPTANVLIKPTERAFCGKCHSKNAARPKNIKQQDITTHNPGIKCVECHNPHQP
ncbi:MAG: multiheme c-type cytochrome [Bacteroidales bacterium]